MQSTTFGRLCIKHRIDLRMTYPCPKKGEHYSEVNVPLIGGNFMPLGKLSLSQERIIDYMLESFFEVARDGCTWKKLRICVGEKVVPYVNFDEYQSIMRHYYEKSLI